MARKGRSYSSKAPNSRARTSAARQSLGVDLDTGAFLDAIQEALDGLVLQSEDDLQRMALRVQNTARQLCPVDTGRLRSSIMASGLERDRRGVYVEVGTNVKYAEAVETGTRHSPAQPFLRPALLAEMRRRGGA